MKSRLLNVLRSYYSKSYSEHLSVNYLPVHLYALHALYSCSTDPELKAAADAALTLHASEMAANFFEGSTIYPWSRSADVQINDPQRNNAINTHIKAVYWLYWAEFTNLPSTSTAVFASAGSRGYGGEARHFALTSALSDWRPPAILAALAEGTEVLPFSLTGTAPDFGEYATGPTNHVGRVVYRDRRFAAGSANYIHRIGTTSEPRGLSQLHGHGIFYKTKDGQNEITVHHPYWRTNSNQYKWLSRSSPFQQNVQHEGTIISLSTFR
jgi:hypothetical protein